MARKTRKDKKTKKIKKINTRKRQRRGGKMKEDWKQGFWSEEPTIHAKFTTIGKTVPPECEYSLYWNYHYLEEDDNIPLETPKNGKRKPNKKREILQIFTNSKATDLMDKSKKNKPKIVGPEKQPYNDCTLSEQNVLKLLEGNPDFQKKVEEGKGEVEEMVEIDLKQKERIKEVLKKKEG